MSRKTLQAGRGVATLAAAAVTVSALGAVFIGASHAASGDDIVVSSAKVVNPLPTSAAPTINAAGPFDGSGTAVTLVGEKFPATPTVHIGGVAATKVLRLSETTIVFDPPAATPGTVDDKVDIVVDGPDDEDAGTLTDGYEYKAAPTLTDAKYSSDFKQLIVSGTNLSTTTDLQLGAIAVKVKPTEITGSTTITVKVPAAASKAAYRITANTLWGSASLGSDWNVRPIASKVVAATSTAGISGGDSKGGTFVRVQGKSLGKVTKVAFGNAEASNFIVSSSSELLVQVPAISATATVGTNNTLKVDVHVWATDLKSAAGPKYEYRVAPEVDGLTTLTTPTDHTVAATSTVVTLTGKNLGGAKLFFGSPTAKGTKSVTVKTGSTALSAGFTMPRVAASGFALNTEYTVWIETKGGLLNTGRKLTVKG